MSVKPHIKTRVRHLKHDDVYISLTANIETLSRQKHVLDTSHKLIHKLCSTTNKFQDQPPSSAQH